MKYTEERFTARIERTGIRIWETLEREGPQNRDALRKLIGPRTPTAIFEGAIRWLLENGFAVKADNKIRSNGSTPLIS